MELENQNEERKVVTAEEFLELILKNNTLERYQVNESLLLNTSIIPEAIDQLVFNDCQFKYIFFHDYYNRMQVTFNNCNIESLNISGNSQQDNLINPSLFKLFIQNNSTINGILIYDHSSLEIDFNDTSIGNLEVNHCNLSKFNCEKTIFKDSFTIEESNFDSITFEHSIFEKYFMFNDSTIADKLNLKRSLFKEQTLFALREKSPDIVKLKISIELCEASDRFVLNGQHSIIEKLLSNRHKGQFEIYNMTIKTIEVNGSFEKEAIHRFSNCHFNHFSCVRISSTIYLYSTKSSGDQSNFIIRSSDLNNASLFDVNLKSFDSVLIEKSDLTNMTTSRVTWFEDKQLKTAFKSTYEDPYERREFYRQLKYNQEKQGNKIQALTFQSLEMKYYSQELAPKNAIANVLLRNKFIAFFGQFILAFTSQNRFILWIGKSNNHGQSFLKPLVFLVVLGLIFNFLIIQSATPQPDLKHLLKRENIQMLPSLLNPVHDISKLLHLEETSFLTGTLDLIWKVVETTLIFQTITAFRKHVRV